MLERISKTKKIFDSREHRKCKQMINAAIMAQTPKLEKIMKQNEGTNIGPLIYTLVREDLEFPISPPGNLLFFAHAIAKGWDETPAEEKKALGLEKGFLIKTSASYALFGSTRSANNSMGKLLQIAEDKKTAFEKWDIMQSFFFGAVSFESVQECFAKKGVSVDNFEKTESGFILISESTKDGVQTRLGYNNILETLESLRKDFAGILHKVAKRLSVGFNPIL